MDSFVFLYFTFCWCVLRCYEAAGQMTDDDIMDYLQKYNYAGANNPSQQVASLMATNPSMAMRVGCMMFQERYNLTMSGNCRDPDTMRLMAMPRCGNPDINRMEDMMSMDAMLNDQRKRKRRYAIQGSRWPSLDLTYNIVQYTPDLSQSAVDTDIELAFRVWEEVTPLTFTRTAANPDIIIAFVQREHGDGAPFDGVSGTLAHAFFPEFGGDAHFDEAETWTVNTFQGVNLFQVAAHEFGHALGLGHSDIETALMAPFYRGYIPLDQFELSSDDIRGIQALYGAPGMTMPPTRNPGQGDRGPPVMPAGAPNVCDDASFDAIFQHMVNGELKTFAFIGEYYIEIDEFGLVEGYPRLISDDWDGLTRVDAVLMFDAGYNQQEGVYARDAYTYIFHGDDYYLYTNTAMERGYPKSIQEDWGLPTDLDAAFQWSGNGLTYFIKGDQYYRFSNVLQIEPDRGYPRPLSLWSESFSRINAAFHYSNNMKTYFFVDEQYYRFNDSTFDIDEGYPLSTGVNWLGCRGQNNQLDGSGAKSFVLSSAALFISFIAGCCMAFL